MTVTTTLPGIELVDLPSLDAEVPCVIVIDDSPPCPDPAAWRLYARCPACGGRGVVSVCHAHHDIMIARGFGRTTTTDCCGVLVEARWERL